MQNTNPVVLNVTPATGVPVSVVPVEDEEVTIPRGLRLASHWLHFFPIIFNI